MKKKILLSTRIILLAWGITASLVALAQPVTPGLPPPSPVPLTGPTSISEGVGAFMKVVQWVYTILFIVATLFIILSAYYFVTSKGDQTKVGNAKKMLLYAVVGIAVGLLSYTIVTLVQKSLSQGGGLM